MAIYSLQCKIIGRGQKKDSGTTSLRTVVAAAAYRAGEQLRNLVDGALYDFTRKQGIVHSEILLPVGAPEQYRDRQTLWNEVEAMERRQDAQYCRELVIALPVELEQAQNIKLARRFIQKHFVARGMCADLSFHDPEPRRGGQRNPHIHVMLTMRDLQAGRFGRKNRDWNQKAMLEGWRELWAKTCNEQLASVGADARIDHRSLKAQGLDQAPTVHIGVQASAMERRGIRTEKGNLNRSIRAHNVAKECGVDAPDILSGIGRLWELAARRRRGREADTAPGVQRRTYTLPSNVVRQGGDPAPQGEEKNTLRGDEARGKRPLLRGQKASPSGEALRQPAPVEPERSGLLQRMAAWFHGDDKRPMSRGESLYDIKVVSSLLNQMARQGIENYAALEQHVTTLASRVETHRGQMLETGRRIGAAKSCGQLHAQAAQLRIQLKQAEELHGAALRCQANRQYAEAYQSKLLFKENYYKKYGDKIDAYVRASEQLKAAGLSDTIAPAQLGQPVEALRKQLATAHQKYLWLAQQLAADGCPAQPTPQQLEQMVATLEQSQGQLKQTLAVEGKELWRWQQLRQQADNVLEGRPAAEPRKENNPGQQDRGR